MSRGILVIGIGNPSRGDDGLGPALAAGMAGAGPDTLSEGTVIGIPGRAASAVWKFQLNIEDAPLIRDFEAVVFADASTEDGGPVEIGRIDPAASIAFTTHEMSPAAVLALCDDLYGRAPEGRLLSIPGYSWELGDGLSSRAIRRLETARARLEEFLARKIPRE